MGIVNENGKIVWVDTKSVHRLTMAEARAFILFSEAEQRRHQKDIDDIEDTIQLVKQRINFLERTSKFPKVRWEVKTKK